MVNLKLKTLMTLLALKSVAIGMPMHGLVAAKVIPQQTPMATIQPAMASINPAMHGLYSHSRNLIPLGNCQVIIGTNAQLCIKNPLNTINANAEVKYNADRNGILNAPENLALNDAFPLATEVKVTNAPVWHITANQGSVLNASIPHSKLITPVSGSFENNQTGKVVKLPLAIVGREYRIVAGMGSLQNTGCSITSFGNNQFIAKSGCNANTLLSSNKGDIAVTLKAIYLSPYPNKAALELGAGNYHLVSPVYWQIDVAPASVSVNGKDVKLANQPVTINLSQFQIGVEKMEALTLVGNNNHQFTVALSGKGNAKDFNSNKNVQLEFKSNVFDHDKVKYSVSCDNTMDYNGQKRCALVNLAEKIPSYNKGEAYRSENPLQLYLHSSNQSGFTNLSGNELLPDSPLYQAITTQKAGYQYDYETLQMSSPGLTTAEPGQWQGIVTINATVAF